MKHGEPWFVELVEIGVLGKETIYNAEIYPDGEAPEDGNEIGLFVDPKDADRIVACVNAFAGIDNPAAYMEKVAKLVEAAKPLNVPQFETTFACPECHAIDVEELSYGEDEMGSMKCNLCGYMGQPGEDFDGVAIVPEELLDALESALADVEQKGEKE